MYILAKRGPVAEGGKGKRKLTAIEMYQGPVFQEFIFEGWLVEKLIQKSQEITNTLQQVNPTYACDF